jgi:anti-sigma regulatory factor (Ser/Thr protein kinase)
MAPGESATICYAVLDPASGAVQLASAGHVPPLLVAPDGTTRFVEVPAAVPLGVRRAGRYSEYELQLEPEHELVLYSDGLVEVPGEALDEGLERLRRTAEAARAEGRPLRDTLVSRLLPPGGGRDDAALLTAVIHPLGDRLRLSLPARPEAVPTMRRVLGRWLAEQGISGDAAYDIKVACSEACANATEHAYAPGPATFHLDAHLHRGAVHIGVSDAGSWRPARGLNRGRGLILMEALMDNVDVRRGDRGTTITLRRRLGT